MIQLLEYLMKSGACLTAFYLIYKYLLSKETFFVLNRAVIIGSVVISMVLPVWTISIVKEVPAVDIVLQTEETAGLSNQVQLNTVPDSTETADIIIFALFVIYAAGVLFFLSKYITGIVRILQILSESERVRTSKGIIYLYPEQIIPFNWFGIIVISQKDFAENGQIILEHELAHIKFGHDFDLLLINLLTALHWFNPFTRLLKNELVTLHEFQADNRVIQKGIDAKTYQYLLIALGTSQSYSIPVVNNLCSGNFKKRIKMMLKKQSNPVRAFKVVLLIPMLAGAVSLFATTEYVTVKSISNENVGISADKMTRLQAVNAVEKIYQKTRSNSLALKSILNYTKRATGNFETMVYLAQMTYEFGYHTTAFVKIAQYASKAGFETDYFKQLADIAVMKLDETYRISDLAEEVAGLKKPVSAEIDKKIQMLRESAKFKNLDEARNYNASMKSPDKKSPQKVVVPQKSQVINDPITKGSAISENLQSDILKHIFQNLRYPQQAKESGDTGKFFIKVRVKNGVVVESKFFKSLEDVNAPMLKELVVVAYRANNQVFAQNNSDINHTAIGDELIRVAKTLPGLENPEWKKLSGEFAVPVHFTLR